MALERKFVRLSREHLSKDWRLQGLDDDREIDVIELYECPLADGTTHLAALRDATFTGFGFTGLKQKKLELRENTPRKNVSQIEVTYGTITIRNLGNGALRENPGKAVVKIRPVLCTRIPVVDETGSHLIGEEYEATVESKTRRVRWEIIGDSEQFFFESKIALVQVECAILLSSGLVATAMRLVGKINAASCPNLGNAGEKTLLMAAPSIEVEAGDTLAMARFNMFYNAEGWDYEIARRLILSVHELKDDNHNVIFKAPFWGTDTTEDPAQIKFTSRNFAAIHALAYWYAT